MWTLIVMDKHCVHYLLFIEVGQVAERTVSVYSFNWRNVMVTVLGAEMSVLLVLLFLVLNLACAFHCLSVFSVGKHGKCRLKSFHYDQYVIVLGPP